MNVCVPCTCSTLRGQKRASGTRGMDSCEPPHRCWRSNPGHLEEHPLLLTAEPSLSPCWFFETVSHSVHAVTSGGNTLWSHVHMWDGNHTGTGLLSHSQGMGRVRFQEDGLKGPIRKVALTWQPSHPVHGLEEYYVTATRDPMSLFQHWKRVGCTPITQDRLISSPKGRPG